MTIGQWERVLTLTKPAEYYGPLNDLLNAIRGGISELVRREVVRIPESAK